MRPLCAVPRVSDVTPRERRELDPGTCCPDCGGDLRVTPKACDPMRTFGATLCAPLVRPYAHLWCDPMRTFGATLCAPLVRRVKMSASFSI
jgi:hypothetical protein